MSSSELTNLPHGLVGSDENNITPVIASTIHTGEGLPCSASCDVKLDSLFLVYDEATLLQNAIWLLLSCF